MYHVHQPFELYVNWEIHLYCIRQGLPAVIEVQHVNIPIPLHEVIHEALGRYSMEPHVPLLLRGEVSLFNFCYDLLI